MSGNCHSQKNRQSCPILTRESQRFLGYLVIGCLGLFKRVFYTLPEPLDAQTSPSYHEGRNHGEPTCPGCRAKAESAARERGRPIEPAPDNAGEGSLERGCSCFSHFPALRSEIQQADGRVESLNPQLSTKNYL